MSFDNSPTITLRKDDYDMLGRILMETLSLSGHCMDMKNNRPHDPLLFTHWSGLDHESQVIYRTAARELMLIFCRMIKLNHAETDDIDIPPWREYYNLQKSQPLSSEPNIIFNALTCGKLPEA